MPHFPEREEGYQSTKKLKTTSLEDDSETGTTSTSDEAAKSAISRNYQSYSSEFESIEELAESVQSATPEKSLSDLRLVLNQQKTLIDKLLEERRKISQLETRKSETRTTATSTLIWDIIRSPFGSNKRPDCTKNDHTVFKVAVEMKDLGTQTEFLCNADEVLSNARDIQHLQDEYIRLQDENEKLRRQLNQRTDGCIEETKEITNSKKNTGNNKIEEWTHLGNEDNGEAKSVNHTPIPVAKPIEKNLDVQIHSNSTSGEIVFSMDEALKRELSARMLSHHVKVNFNMMTGKGKLHEPSIIICPIFSRIGTDVDTAFSGLENVGNGTFLLVIHNKEEHNLPKVKSENLLSKYSRLGGILDMAYRKDKSFYSTSLNDYSFGILVNFLLNYVDK